MLHNLHNKQGFEEPKPIPGARRKFMTLFIFHQGRALKQKNDSLKIILRFQKGVSHCCRPTRSEAIWISLLAESENCGCDRLLKGTGGLKTPPIDLKIITEVVLYLISIAVFTELEYLVPFPNEICFLNPKWPLRRKAKDTVMHILMHFPSIYSLETKKKTP